MTTQASACCPQKPKRNGAGTATATTHNKRCVARSRKSIGPRVRKQLILGQILSLCNRVHSVFGTNTNVDA